MPSAAVVYTSAELGGTGCKGTRHPVTWRLQLRPTYLITVALEGSWCVWLSLRSAELGCLKD